MNDLQRLTRKCHFAGADKLVVVAD